MLPNLLIYAADLAYKACVNFFFFFFLSFLICAPHVTVRLSYGIRPSETPARELPYLRIYRRSRSHGSSRQLVMI
jgi:hypothetical protein